MRRTVALIASAGLALGVLALAPSASAEPVPPSQFGLHVIADPTKAVVPATAYGSVRIWDLGVSWGKVNPKKGKFWWTGLDRAIANARNQKVSVVYVLGSTPTWAASNTKQGAYPNKGAASMPSTSAWKDWVTAVAKRYRGQGIAYQIWNEANLKDFWAGSPAQMATLTKTAAQIIRKYDPTATIVSASTTVRLAQSYNTFFPQYLAGLRKAGWPVDVYSVHLYPDGSGTPATRAGYIAQVKASLAAAGAPAKPLWDTEVNYGFAGPGPVPGQNIDGDTAAAYVAQTYLDDVRLGVARAYWYSYTLSPYSRGGIQMMPGSAGTVAYNTVYGWLANSDTTCVTAAVNTCTITKDGKVSTVAWASSDSGAFTVPGDATTATTASGVTSPVTPGSTVTVGIMPQLFG